MYRGNGYICFGDWKAAHTSCMGTMHPMKRGTFPLGERNSFDGMAVKTNIALLLERVTEDFVPFPAPL